MGWPSTLIIGSAAGYAAGQVMDRVTTIFRDRQSESSRQRERQLQEALPTTVLVKKVGEAGGRKVEDEQAERTGGWLHQAIGAAAGVAAAIAVRRGTNPLRAGMVSALGMWVLVDEGANYALGLTPAATEYPLVTHVRGFIGHAVLGLALGAFLAVARGQVRR